MARTRCGAASKVLPCSLGLQHRAIAGKLVKRLGRSCAQATSTTSAQLHATRARAEASSKGSPFGLMPPNLQQTKPNRLASMGLEPSSPDGYGNAPRASKSARARLLAQVGNA
eukprot:5958239-Lingulodinium_polyedra.AAC.1